MNNVGEFTSLSVLERCLSLNNERIDETQSNNNVGRKGVKKGTHIWHSIAQKKTGVRTCGEIILNTPFTSNLQQDIVHEIVQINAIILCGSSMGKRYKKVLAEKEKNCFLNYIEGFTYF